MLVPTTGERGPLLERALRSVLRQTVADLEVFVMGDGAGDGTRETAARIAAADRRVRFFDHAKGERRGEPHRHAALAEARGRIVAYLCDRDLMLPDHVATVAELLRGADFAHSLVSRLRPDGGPEFTVEVDLAVARDRRWVLSGWAHENGIPLSFAAHTLEAYRRLPEGWRTTPPGSFTDIHMWEQFLAEPRCRAVSGARPTILYFPSYLRRGWSLARRCAELDAWIARIEAPGGPEAYRAEALAALHGDWLARSRRLRSLAAFNPLRRLDRTVRREGRRLRDGLLRLRNGARAPGRDGGPPRGPSR